MPHLLRIISILLVVALVVYMLRPRPLFVLDLRQRRVVVRRGKAPAMFLRDCESALRMHDIPDGTIRAYPSRAGASLSFSRSIPREYHQTFRNIWHVSGGWS